MWWQVISTPIPESYTKTGCVVVLGAIQAASAMRDEGMAIVFAQEREVSCLEGIEEV
jgi:hypothetical protein